MPPGMAPAIPGTIERPTNGPLSFDGMVRTSSFEAEVVPGRKFAVGRDRERRGRLVG